MKRRVFLRNSAIAVGLAGAPSFLRAANGGINRNSSPLSGVDLVEIRSAKYLGQAKLSPFLPKLPEFVTPAISPMPLEERIKRKIIPQRGFCSLAPGGDSLLSGNGAMNIELMGDPFTEQIPFSHESIFTPKKKNLEAPNIANVLPQVRQMMLDGKYQEAAKLAYDEWQKNPVTRSGMGGGGRFSMLLEVPKSASVKNYLRTVDFETTELKVHWTDERGDWVRSLFSSRPDNVVVQWLTAPAGQSVNARIKLSEAAAGGRAPSGVGLNRPAAAPAAPSNTKTDFNEQRLIFKGQIDPSYDNRGFASVTRIVRQGGTVKMDGTTVVVENATSLMLLTRIEYFPEYSEEKVEAVVKSLEQLNTDYTTLLERARKIQAEMLNRVTLDFGEESKYGLSSEELLSDQRSNAGYSGAFLKTFFEACRYWFIITTGKYRTVSALTNVNTNLQIASMAPAYHREGELAYFEWVESLVTDYRNNAKNIYGMRGAHYPIAPTKDSGVFNMFDYAENTGERWPHPYWISAGGWVVRPFWDYYQVTGDLDFLRNRMVPLYKDIALFYEDFLTVTDKNGNYVFVPSFSPENHPGNLNPSCMAVINASMDISVCREVLSNLIEACETLGIESDNVPKWKKIIDKLPPFLTEPDGTLKEWALDSLAERYNHRHISQCYGAWPGDEFDPDRTPKLAKAALLANRKRVHERLAAHSHCQRALVGARLKDNYMVDSELRQILEQGFVPSTYVCPHDPYSTMRIADAQGGIPAIMMEMLAYSRPGVIEVLPALPPTLTKGTINGMLLRTCVRLDKLSWNMDTQTVDLTVTSTKKQDITLIARYGIEEITAASGILAAKPIAGEATCDLHLPEGKPVDIHLKIGRRNPLDWTNWA